MSPSGDFPPGSAGGPDPGELRGQLIGKVPTADPQQISERLVADGETGLFGGHALADRGPALQDLADSAELAHLDIGRVQLPRRLITGLDLLGGERPSAGRPGLHAAHLLAALLLNLL